MNLERPHMSVILKFFLFMTLSVVIGGCALFQRKKDEKICDRIIVKEGKITLNANEKVLICGSEKGGGGWTEIPLSQAQFHLTSHLQAQGFLNPRFERAEGETLLVWSGPLTKTKALVIKGADGWLHDARKRKIVGQPLMPAKLNEATSWADRSLRSRGFACPTVQAEGHEWNQEIEMDVQMGPRAHIGEIKVDGTEGLHEQATLRYRAFDPGDWYDVRATQLTTSRMLSDGLFQSAYFVPTCHGELVDLELRTSVGKPRIFRFGIGASTEELPFIDVVFRNTRLDDRASSFTASLHASPVVQSVDLISELYWFYEFPKMFFGPRFRVERQSERSLEDFTSKAGTDLGVKWDQWSIRHTGRFGPSLNYAKTIRGVGPTDAKYLSFEGSFSMTSHDYELYVRDQYEGWLATLQFQGQRRGLGSGVSVDRYDFEYKYLWNIGAYSPPLFVLGARFQGSIVNADSIDQNDVRTILPSEYRIFYGGDQNLRGFSRQSLNSNGLGYVTAAYLGLELRLVEEVPYGLQPFLLWDGARLGSRKYTVDPPIYISEGLGLRWASPIGTLRGSAARGRIWDADASTTSYQQQWLYFLSFGQEF